MTKIHRYFIQSLALLIYGIYVFQNPEGRDKYFYLVVLCCFEIVITLAYIFFNRKVLKKEETQLDFISIYAYIVVIVIVSMFFLM